MKAPGSAWKGSLQYALLAVVCYFLSQSIITLAHEYAHSTAAWLLGYSHTPNTVVWGNLITMHGWDEGVPYDQLFPHGHQGAESVIGGIPLVLHFLFVAGALTYLLRKRGDGRWLTFTIAYWFVIANLAELVAYLWMRPFIPTGDTGRFNAGLGLSPWPLFLVGNLLLLLAFVLVLCNVVPKLDWVVGGDAGKHWINVGLSAFFLFLWSSGFRLLSLYPDPQWKWGLSGFVGFAVWLLAGRRAGKSSPTSAF